MENKIPQELLKIYKEFDNCQRCKKENNPLSHILGGGKFIKPRFLFLFINPTHLNISSHKNYQGQRRYPFIGVRYFYRLLSKAGFVDKKLVDNIYKRGWQIEDEYRIEQSLTENEVYITNLVKCTQLHPDNPTKVIIEENLPLLKEEINIVSPRYLVAFGKLVFKVLTNEDILLKECLKRIKDDTYHPFQSIDILGKQYDVLPCYFPIGRGRPRQALQILKYIKRKYSN